MLLNTEYSITLAPLLRKKQAAEAALVVHRGVEPRFSEPKSGVIPIYEWTALSKKRAKVLLFFELTKFFAIILHFFVLFLIWRLPNSSSFCLFGRVSTYCLAIAHW